MKNTLSLKLTNKLVLTLSLKQQLKLLTLNQLQLKEEIKQELQENPFLEEIPYIESQISYIEDKPSLPIDEDENLSPLNRLAYKPSLYDILEFQIDLEFDGIEKEIAKELIWNTDEKGLLSVSIEEIAKKLKTTEEKVESVRKKVINLEPTGICALSIEEALIVQYREKFGEDKIVERIIKEDIFNLKDKDYLTSKYNISLNQLEKILCNMKQLVPYPTFNFLDKETQYIEPDIFIYEKDDDFLIEVNQQDIPKLKLTSQYRKLISREDLPLETREFLKEKLEKALGIIKGIEQRRKNILKITKVLVSHQRDFLKYGKQHLKPLTLKDVASQVELHESTVSRIVSNKYAYTPQGVIPLKAFFAGKLLSTTGYAEISVEKVKSIIKQLIENEDKRKPLSDETISKILRKEYKINIARRTVAKYREELKILDSRKRRIRK